MESIRSISSCSAKKRHRYKAGTVGSKGKRRAHKAESHRVLVVVEVEEEEEDGFVMVKPNAKGPVGSKKKESTTDEAPPHQHAQAPARPTPEDEKPRDLDVWKRTKEEEERLYKVLNGPIPSPPPSTTFVWPPTEAEEVVIQQVLYGPRHGRRLPVFSHVCPE